MKKHIMFIFILIALVFLCLFQISTFAVNAKLFPEGISRDAALEYILNYPFSTLSDLRKIQGQLKLLSISNKPNTDYFSSPEFFAEIKAYTSTQVNSGEKLSIVNFARSTNKALRALREEVKIPPPKGGAIVRVYDSKAAMPPPIRVLFRGDIQGITHWRRFIAVKGARKSPEELENIISHELVHSYIFSALGANDTLPGWFNEGVALYLSNTKDRYITPGGIYGDLISRASDDYEEYRQVFRYLHHTLGRRGVIRFIRQTIEEQSVMNSLPEIAGASDYLVLRNKSREWRLRRQNLFSGIGIGLIILVVSLGSWWGYRYRLRLKANVLYQIKQLGKVIRSYNRQIAVANRRLPGVDFPEERRNLESGIKRLLKKKAFALVDMGRVLAKLGERSEASNRYAEALEIAGWSPEVAEAVQLARDELEGLIV